MQRIRTRGSDALYSRAPLAPGPFGGFQAFRKTRPPLLTLIGRDAHRARRDAGAGYYSFGASTKYDKEIREAMSDDVACKERSSTNVIDVDLGEGTEEVWGRGRSGPIAITTPFAATDVYL